MTAKSDPARAAAKRPGRTPRPADPSLGRRIARFWPAGLAVLLFLVIWAVLADTVFAGKPYLLPGPWLVAQTGWEIRDSILLSARTTLISALIGYAVSIVGGMAFAMIMAESKAMERSLYPWAVILQVTPIIAIAPIIIIWFGFNSTSIVIIAAAIAFFPILNNTHLGLVSTDKNQVELFRLQHVGWLTTFWHLRLPAAIPSIIAGLRVSAGLAVTGTILGEFVIGTAGSYGGLGVRIIMSQAVLNTPQLYAYVLATTLLGLTFFAIVSYLGYRLLRDWHESARKEVAD